jgi:predicted metalloprotease
VLGETEDVWSSLFTQNGGTYQEPRLVLFSGTTQSACGYASAATGPFYCSADQRVYLDTDFFNELEGRFGASGDFAQAYVIAHEIGHHVQNLLGIMDKVQAMQQRGSQEQANELSVRLELQADFFAGVWAHHADRTRNILEAGDIEEALNAASAIGDDRIQKRTQGYVVPDAFTHGTSEQRVRWFTRGYETGDIQQGDTFAARDL